ncbi:hypothetical protein AB3N59_05850 [Leptospira sp. WS92.C1]
MYFKSNWNWIYTAKGKFWISFLIVFFLFPAFQIFLFPFLVSFQEKNSFLYDRLSAIDSSLYTNSSVSFQTNPIVFLGDSQILSGIYPKILETSLGFPIWFLPRPSEQPEGMLLRWKEYESKIGTKPSLVIINGSVFSLSDMDVASAHRSLVLNYDSFHTEIFTESILRNFYLKNVSSGFYYLFGRLFPFLRLNAFLSTSIRIVGEGDEFSFSEKKLERLLSGNPILKWNENRMRNRFLESEYLNHKGYMDWARYAPYDGICIPNSNPISLPANSELALQKIRSSSLKAWKELFLYLKSKQIPILALSLPFRPDFDSRLVFLSQMSVWEAILIEEKIQYLKIESGDFIQEDFGDYTHLNTCGMQKLTAILSKKIAPILLRSASDQKKIRKF